MKSSIRKTPNAKDMREKHKAKLRSEGRNISDIISPVKEELRQKLSSDPILEVVSMKPTLSFKEESKPLSEEAEPDLNYNETFGDTQEGFPIRSDMFIVFRTLLKLVKDLEELCEISLEQKHKLKDLIISEEKSLVKAAQRFEINRDLSDLRNTMKRLALS